MNDSPKFTIIAGVNKVLALKKSLGHYAVVWDEETKKVVRIEAQNLPECQ